MMGYSILTTYKIQIKDAGGLEIQTAKKTENLLIVNELNSSIIEIATGIVDQPISLGGVATGKYLVVETDNPISIKLNDVGASSIPIDEFLILKGGNYTELYVTNSGVNPATVRFTIGG